MKMIS